jgi:hypothetical protein
MRYTQEKDLDMFLTFLNKNNLSMKPCSAEEMDSILKAVKNNHLPNAYVKFMQAAGNGFRAFRGSSFAVNEIFHLREGAEELLEEDESAETLTDNEYVFFMHQGYQFYFFRLNEGDDPPIYYYGEGEYSHKFVKKYNSFTEFLIGYYNEVERLIKN